MKYKKMIVLSLNNPLDATTWSGIPYFMIKALSRYYSIETIYLKNKLAEKFIKVLLKLFSLFIKGVYDSSHSRMLSVYYGRYFSNQLKKLNAKDAIIVAPAGSSILAYLRTDIPIVYISDATFNRMIDYYPNFSGLSEISIKEGNEIERNAIRKSKISAFASEWAAQSAINDYQGKSDKVFVIPFGANIKEPIYNITQKSDISKKCYLLFLGVNWHRKGGDVVYQTFKDLKNKGYNVHLTICGCVPPFKINDTGVEVIPFLNKNNNADYQRFVELMKRTHWLILPTKAECYGIVFCEASAYSVPSVTFNTGGVSSAVYDGVNGKLLDVSSTHKEYAEIIEYYICNKEEYIKLSESSYKIYKEKLNWDIWVNELISKINYFIR